LKILTLYSPVGAGRLSRQKTVSPLLEAVAVAVVVVQARSLSPEMTMNSGPRRLRRGPLYALPFSLVG